MMRIQIADVAEFRKLVFAISKLIDTATIEITPKFFKLRAMDNTHVVLLYLKLKAAWFPELFCNSVHRITFPLGNLAKILATSKDETLFVIADEEHHLHCDFKTEQASTRSFNLKFFEPQEDPPELDYKSTAKFSLSAANLKRIIQSSALMSDYISFSVLDSNELVAKAAGDDGDVEINFTEFTETPEIDANVQETVYSLEFLKDIMAAGSVGLNVTVELGTNLPAKFLFHLRDGGQLIYYLSPRVEEEEDEEAEMPEVQEWEMLPRKDALEEDTEDEEIETDEDKEDLVA